MTSVKGNSLNRFVPRRFCPRSSGCCNPAPRRHDWRQQTRQDDNKIVREFLRHCMCVLKSTHLADFELVPSLSDSSQCVCVFFFRSMPTNLSTNFSVAFTETTQNTLSCSPEPQNKFLLYTEPPFDLCVTNALCCVGYPNFHIKMSPMDARCVLGALN